MKKIQKLLSTLGLITAIGSGAAVGSLEDRQADAARSEARKLAIKTGLSKTPEDLEIKMEGMRSFMGVKLYMIKVNSHHTKQQEFIRTLIRVDKRCEIIGTEIT